MFAAVALVLFAVVAVLHLVNHAPIDVVLTDVAFVALAAALVPWRTP